MICSGLTWHMALTLLSCSHVPPNLLLPTHASQHCAGPKGVAQHLAQLVNGLTLSPDSRLKSSRLQESFF